MKKTNKNYQLKKHSVDLEIINICILVKSNKNVVYRCIRSLKNNLDSLNTLKRGIFNIIILCDNKNIDKSDIKLDKFEFIRFDGDSKYLRIKKLYKESCKLGINYFSYYLDDMDELLPNSLNCMFKTIHQIKPEQSDNYLFSYSPYVSKKVDHIKIFNFLKFNNFDGLEFSIKHFTPLYDSRNFRFGMLLFRNSQLNIKDFSEDNITGNNYKLFQKLKGNIKISKFHIFSEGFLDKIVGKLSDTNDILKRFKFLISRKN